MFANIGAGTFFKPFVNVLLKLLKSPTFQISVRSQPKTERLIQSAVLFIIFKKVNVR